MAKQFLTALHVVWAALVVAHRPLHKDIRRTVVHPDGSVDGASSLLARKSVMIKDFAAVERDVKKHTQVTAETSPQTSWRCVGEESTNRHCIFKNLYYGTTSNGGFPGFLMLVTGDGKTDKFEQDIQVERADKYEGSWSPQVKSFPSEKQMEDFIAAKVLLEEPGLSLQFNPLFHHNIGHAIFDGLYPAFVALTALGHRDRNFRPVVSVDSGCFDEFPSGGLEPGVLIETYIPDPTHGRSLRAVHAKVKDASLMQQQQRQCTFKKGLDSIGLDLGSMSVADDKACCKECSGTFGCKSAVLVGSLCYLKGKCDGDDCSSPSTADRLLCTLQGKPEDNNVTVLVEGSEGSTSEVNVPESWIVGRVRRRCMSEGIFEKFGRSGEMRRLFEMDRDFEANENLLVRFDEIIFGVGGVGNMISDKSGAIGGSLPPTEAMAHFRDRMYAAYDIPVNHEKPKRGDKLNIMVVANKRYNPKDTLAIDGAIKAMSNQDAVLAEFVDWGRLGQGDNKFRDQLKRISQADVYVSSIGTALQYVPFMRDGRVYVALGSLWQRSQRVFPTFMEQQLAGGGTPYLRTLYADPGSVLRHQKPEAPGTMLMDLGEDGYRASVNGSLLVSLLKQANGVVRDGFRIPVPVEENLSQEGQVILELCKRDPKTCEQMNAARNRGPCTDLLWNECIVYEVGPWSEGSHCTVNRKLLRQLRKEKGLFSYGAPEV